MLHCQICKINLSYLLLLLLCIDRQGYVDKVLIVEDFNIHVDNTNDALGLYAVLMLMVAGRVVNMV